MSKKLPQDKCKGEKTCFSSVRLREILSFINSIRYWGWMKPSDTTPTAPMPRPLQPTFSIAQTDQKNPPPHLIKFIRQYAPKLAPMYAYEITNTPTGCRTIPYVE